MTTISIISAGAMGSAIAVGLTARGVRVVTSLDGRGDATRARASAAGMEDADDAGLAGAGIILSIVPPAGAMELARRFAPLLAAAERKPVFIDCNALNVATKRAVAEVIAPTGAPFIDAAIIGAPPRAEGRVPRIYVSGDDLAPASTLRELGLDIRPIDGGVGAASALKMSFAGINKGLTALACVMVLAAGRAGAVDALRAELAESEPELLARFARTLPDMVPKAYRWIAEMEEIAGFLGDDEAGGRIFAGAGRVFEHLASEGGGDDIACLRDFAAAARRA